MKTSNHFSGKTITNLVGQNPRREGTHGHKSFSLIKKGMTYEEFLAAGGRYRDLLWDLQKGNIAMVGDGVAPVVKAEPKAKTPKATKKQPKVKAAKATKAKAQPKAKKAKPAPKAEQKAAA